jgi:hypothetical protein
MARPATRAGQSQCLAGIVVRGGRTSAEILPMPAHRGNHRAPGRYPCRGLFLCAMGRLRIGLFQPPGHDDAVSSPVTASAAEGQCDQRRIAMAGGDDRRQIEGHDPTAMTADRVHLVQSGIHARGWKHAPTVCHSGQRSLKINAWISGGIWRAPLFPLGIHRNHNPLVGGSNPSAATILSETYGPSLVM